MPVSRQLIELLFDVPINILFILTLLNSENQIFLLIFLFLNHINKYYLSDFTTFFDKKHSKYEPTFKLNIKINDSTFSIVKDKKNLFFIVLKKINKIPKLSRLSVLFK